MQVWCVRCDVMCDVMCVCVCVHVRVCMCEGGVCAINHSCVHVWSRETHPYTRMK